MRKFKYVHILWRNDEKFNVKIVRFINELASEFNSKDHLFVTPHQKVYDAIKMYNNTLLDTDKEYLTNKYAPFCNWVISHAVISFMDIFKIKRKYLKKVLYRYWGGNFGFQYKKGHFLSNLVKLPANVRFKNRVNKFAAIGIANNIDVLSLEGKTDNKNFYRMPYANAELDNIIKRVKSTEVKNEDVLKIALYHRGTPEGNHIEILEKLKKFGNKVRIYVPLSYGDKEYIQKVKEYIKENCTSNVIVMDEFIEYEKYAEFIHSVDIGVFDCVTSTALGNISLYLTFRKKIYLNENGIIKKAFENESIPHESIDSLENQSFEELSKLFSFPEKMEYSIMPLDKEGAINAWKKILADFN